MSLVTRKPVFGVSDQFRHKPSRKATEDGKRLEKLDLRSRRIVQSVCSENKGTDQRSRSAALISAFVFAHVKSRFSHDAAYN